MRLNSENRFKKFARDTENQTDTYEGIMEINNSELWKFLMPMNLVSHDGELIPEMATYQKASQIAPKALYLLKNPFRP